MFDHQSILPPTSTPAELALEHGIAKTRPDLSPVASLMDPATCPEALLPWLAWAFLVSFWDASWSLETRRSAIVQSVPIHLTNGILVSVKRALAAAGYGAARVVERFGSEKYDSTYLHDGSATYATPDHWAEYRVYLTRPITIEQAAQVRAILASVAPARCHLKGLFFTEALNTYNNRIRYDGAFTHGVA